MKTVLLLAGTAEAREFAIRFDAQAQSRESGDFVERREIPAFAGMTFDDGPISVRLIASLAGATARPLSYPCETRSGGFGGAGGLRDYLSQQRINAVIDATHPFATGITRNAIEACNAQSIPLLALVRSAWEPIGDWNSFGTLDEAVAALPPNARVLATTGRKHIDPYAARSDLTVFLRSVDLPDSLPPHIVPIAARGPFTVEAETALMRDNRITHLLTRNAGGESRARLDAATALGLPIHVVERPPHSAVNVAHTVVQALQWLSDVLRD